MKAMILAAGRGERLRPLTDITPKALVKAGGKPLIQYHIENLASAGVRDVVINTSWLGDKIESFIGNGSAFGVNVQWSREHKPLETGGGICRALSLLGSEPFLLVNADVWTDFSLKNLAEKVLPSEIDAHLILVPNASHHMDGDFILTADSIVSIPNARNNTYTYSGISILRPKIFTVHTSPIEKFPLRDVLRESMASGRIKGEIYTGVWRDAGTLMRLQELDECLMKR
jgi:N-acetyl-alpha-D-muramate 1-phosphate uridylyltransferase|tara:strand:+ start:1088 stop:1774 length:687 start_codon:yes stop_codon:yes gene_type:complete